MNSTEIRQQFIDFFHEKGHSFVPSSPVVPYEDPTLLFTNAGMNQFKDVFLGTGRREYTRAVNSQKCIRAGGKHNDLDDVGHDTYHHTFFEMLGNWSFGDYFKREAIEWAWELLTRRWGIDKSRLHATVFKGDAEQGLQADEEAAELWRTVTDINPQHIHYFGKKDNFWEMGDTGPCGPCSEIHIDLTADKSGAKLVNAGDARVMEIWNLVFIQFDRDADGKLTPLPAKHVDTGMGFERVTSVLQGKKSNYDTDIFAPIFEAIREVTGADKYTGLLEGPGDQSRDDQSRDRKGADLTPGAPAGRADVAAGVLAGRHAEVMKDVAYRVIADHIRCLTFALTDGATLSNEGRGYVLRRILRRAVRYGRQYFDVHEPFLHRVVSSVVATMCGAFPELRKNPPHVAEVIREEEQSFLRTLDRGISLFNDAADYARRHHHGRIKGDDAFKLHDTYGFPIDLTELMAEEQGLAVDFGEYERLMEEARATARASASDLDTPLQEATRKELEEHRSKKLLLCDDTPKYDASHPCKARFLTMAHHSRLEDSDAAKKDDHVAFSVDRTSFYAEQGGQIFDTGTVTAKTGQIRVTSVHRLGDHIQHRGMVTQGEIWPGQECEMAVDRARRLLIMKNHTGTHILNWTLREVLGGHVEQKGSLVDAEKTRFDFSHPKPLTPEEIKTVEDQSNDQIRKDHPVYTAVVPQAEARRINTLRAVFGEKYPDMVRVVSIGAPIEGMIRKPDDRKWMHYSVEFCGGTHLRRSSEAELFRIVEEGAVAKGVRRITAVTGDRAKECDTTDAQLQREFDDLSKFADDRLTERLPEFSRRLNDADCTYLTRLRLRQQVTELQNRVKKFEKQQAKAGAKDVRTVAEQLLAEAESAGGARIIVGELPSASPEQIRQALDYLRTQAGSAGICLGTSTGDKVLLFAAMTDDLVARGLKAGDLIKDIAPIVGGGGGGKPQLAQAGGKHPAELHRALQEAKNWLLSRLKT